MALCIPGEAHLGRVLGGFVAFEVGSCRGQSGRLLAAGSASLASLYLQRDFPCCCDSSAAFSATTEPLVLGVELLSWRLWDDAEGQRLFFVTRL